MADSSPLIRLAASAEKAGAKYLCLIMGAEADDKEIYSYYTANKLLDHVFDEYGKIKAISGGEKLIELPDRSCSHFT